MILKIEQGLAIGYKERSVATVTEDLVFETGQVSLLLGLNGQGKTTLMKTLAGLIPPVSGSVSPTRMLYLSDEVVFPSNLTPVEIVKSLEPAARFRELGQEMLASLEVEHKKYGLLSKGNPRKRASYSPKSSRERET